MSQTPQQLDSRSSTEKLKHFQSELDVQLKLCKKIVEEGTKTSRIGAEQIRHVDDFIKTFRMLRTVTLEEICRTVPEIEDYDRSTLSQMLQTRKDINDKLDQLVHHVDELIEHLKKKYTQLSSCKNSRVASRLSRRRCGSESTFRYPAYDCKKLPGPSGCSYWNCRTNTNVVDDGETAFMVLEDAK